MKKIFFLTFVLLLTACATKPDEIPVLVNREVLSVPVVPAIEQYPYDWVVINKGNVQEKLDELTKNDSAATIIGLTPEGYVNQTLSMAELRKYIQEQQAVLDAYKSYYAKMPSPLNTQSNQPDMSNVKATPFWKFW